MRYDLTDLQLFANIAEAGTITGGAKATYLTVAAASERIKNMEDALGKPLLIRSKQGVSLTEAGSSVLRHARLVLQQLNRMHGELQDLGGNARGHVRLLCNTSAVSEHLPGAIGAFLREHPSISVDLEERPSPEIADALRDGACDLGVMSDAADAVGLQVFPFRADPLVLVLPGGHPLAARDTISIQEVLDSAFVGLSEDSALQQLIDRQLRRMGKRVHYRLRLRSLDAVCALVSQGIGVGIAPQALAMRHAQGLPIRHIALRDAWAQRKLLLCARNRDELPSHAQKLLDHLLRSSAASHAGAPLKRIP